jgi:hypothetical protein
MQAASVQCQFGWDVPVRLGHGRETAPFAHVSLSDLAAHITAHARSLVAMALWGLLMSVVISWIARSRERPRSAAAAQRLQHPISTLIVGLSGFLFFAAIAVVSNVFANATTSWKTTTVFAGFALLALPILGDYFAARHEVSEEGLRYGRLFTSGGYMRWTDLKSIRFSDAMKWFRLESQSGSVVRLSVMLMGLLRSRSCFWHTSPDNRSKRIRSQFCKPRQREIRPRFGARPGTRVMVTDSYRGVETLRFEPD